MKERRLYGREQCVIDGYELYRNGKPVPVAQPVISRVLLDRSLKGLWVPSYPTPEPTPIGDDVEIQILQEQFKSAK